MADFQGGDRVRVKAAFVRRGPNQATQVANGQVFELDDEFDAPLLKRNDLIYLLELASENDGPQEQEVDEVDAPELDALGKENFAARLESLTVDRAISFLADYEEDEEVLQAALDAERDGQDRTTLINWIQARLDEFED